MRPKNLEQKVELLEKIKQYNRIIHVSYYQLCNELGIDHSNFVSSFKDPGKISLNNLERILQLEKKYYKQETDNLDSSIFSMLFALKGLEANNANENDIEIYKGVIKRSVAGKLNLLSDETLEQLKLEKLI